VALGGPGGGGDSGGGGNGGGGGGARGWEEKFLSLADAKVWAADYFTVDASRSVAVSSGERSCGLGGGGGLADGVGGRFRCLADLGRQGASVRVEECSASPTGFCLALRPGPGFGSSLAGGGGTLLVAPRRFKHLLEWAANLTQAAREAQTFSAGLGWEAEARGASGAGHRVRAKSEQAARRRGGSFTFGGGAGGRRDAMTPPPGVDEDGPSVGSPPRGGGSLGASPLQAQGACGGPRTRSSASPGRSALSSMWAAVASVEASGAAAAGDFYLGLPDEVAHAREGPYGGYAVSGGGGGWRGGSLRGLPEADEWEDRRRTSLSMPRGGGDIFGSGGGGGGFGRASQSVPRSGGGLPPWAAGAAAAATVAVPAKSWAAGYRLQRARSEGQRAGLGGAAGGAAGSGAVGAAASAAAAAAVSPKLAPWRPPARA